MNGKVHLKGFWERGTLNLGNNKYFDYLTGKTKEYVIPDYRVVMKNEADWINLSRNITELKIDALCCNDITGRFVIEGFDSLKSIFVMRGSMNAVTSFVVHDCKRLQKIEIDGGEDVNNADNSTFEKVNTVELSSLLGFLL